MSVMIVDQDFWDKLFDQSVASYRGMGFSEVEAALKAKASMAECFRVEPELEVYTPKQRAEDEAGA